MRINKLLSNLGVCSRKEGNRIIEEGRIKVNGNLCIPGQWIDEEKDVILMDDKPINERDKIYILLNKPIGIVCTAAKEVKDNIIDYINYGDYIFPVGRLDKESQGLILLTNDGELANRILESDNNHEKEYIVKVDKEFDDDFINNMAKGVEILGVTTRACVVKKINGDTFKIVLTQGLNKQIRRMTKVFGYKVVKLERIRILNLKIDGIDYGKWRYISEEEILKLRSNI